MIRSLADCGAGCHCKPPKAQEPVLRCRFVRSTDYPHEDRSFDCRRRPDVLRKLHARQHAGGGTSQGGGRCRSGPGLYAAADRRRERQHRPAGDGRHQRLSGREPAALAADAGAGAAAARPAVAGLLGGSARRQHAPGTAWAAGRGHVPRRRRAAERRYPTAYRLAASRGPARHRPLVQRHARRTGPSARRTSGRAGHRHAVGRRQLPGEASRPVLRPGPGRVAGPGRRSGRPGGHVRILRRFHGRVSGRAAQRRST